MDKDLISTLMQECYDKLKSLPEAIEVVLTKKFELDKQRQELLSDLKFAEITIREIVNAEVDDSGKKAFSNQQQRDDETTKRLASDSDSSGKQKLLRDVEEELKKENLTLELLDYKFKAVRAQTELLVSLLKKD